VLVNDALDRTFTGLQAILAAERLKRSRREAPIDSLVTELSSELARTRVG
jgi:hypothetical protein